MVYGPIVMLLQKYLRGDLTPVEAEQLESWADQDTANRRLLDSLHVDGWLREELLAFDALAPTNPEREAADMAGRIMGREVRKRINMRRWLPYAAAAAAFIVAIGTWLVIGNRWSLFVERQFFTTEIPPGGNRATLTLADGRSIDLSETQAGVIVGDGITYVDGSQVMEQATINAQLLTLNSITTPKGGTYQITLPDGSKVWLNANSTLKYPSRFSKDSREVFLDGEAFFEVQPQVGSLAPVPTDREAQHIAPFSVLTAHQAVQVLGTAFNISAYADDPETKTTLVAGKVRVAGAVNAEPVVLTPGYQARNGNGQLTIQQVDVLQFTAWKDGNFKFNNTPLPTVMAQLARWYDLEIVYTGTADKSELYGGTISRNTPLSTVLHLLEEVGDVRFEMNGRQVVLR